MVRTIHQSDPFRQLYSLKPVSPARPAGVASTSPRLTLSCHKMPLPVFCRILSDRFSIGMVYGNKLDLLSITGEFKNTDLQSVLNVVSRQLAVDIVRVGNTCFIGELRPEDRAFLVRRVLGYDADSLNKAIQSMISDKGKISVFGSLVVVTDHESVIRRISELLDYLDLDDSDTWVVQLCFVLLRKDMLLNAGFDVSSSGTLAYNISDNRLELKDLNLEGIFNAGASSNLADVYASPVLLLRDDCAGVWKDGQKIPIPKRTVSNYGVVSVSGYDYVETGFAVNAKVTRSKRGGRLTLKIEMSDVVKVVEEAPQTSQSICSIDADLVPGKVSLVGELSQFKFVDKQSNILNFGTDRGKSVLQVWAQIHRIGGTSFESPKLPYLRR